MCIARFSPASVCFSIFRVFWVIRESVLCTVGLFSCVPVPRTPFAGSYADDIALYIISRHNKYIYNTQYTCIHILQVGIHIVTTYCCWVSAWNLPAARANPSPSLL